MAFRVVAMVRWICVYLRHLRANLRWHAMCDGYLRFLRAMAAMPCAL